MTWKKIIKKPNIRELMEEQLVEVLRKVEKEIPARSGEGNDLSAYEAIHLIEDYLDKKGWWDDMRGATNKPVGEPHDSLQLPRDIDYE